MSAQHLQLPEPMRLEVDLKIKEALLKHDIELEVMVAKSDSNKTEDALNRVDIMRLVAFFNKNNHVIVKNEWSLDIFVRQTDLENDYRITVNGQEHVAAYFKGETTLSRLATMTKSPIEIMTKTPSKKIPLISYVSDLISRREQLVDPVKDLKMFNTILGNADAPGCARKFRLKHRKSFQRPGSDWRTDLTQVKMTEAYIKGDSWRRTDFESIPIKTELEVELVTKTTETASINEIVARVHQDLASLLFNIIRNLFRTPLLVDPSEAFATTKGYVNLFWGTTSTPIKGRADIRTDLYYVNKKPKALVYNNISAIPDHSTFHNLFVNGPYAATYKADGENCQLFIDGKGQINLIYATPGVMKMARLPGSSAIRNVVCSAELIDAKEHGIGLSLPQVLIYEIYVEGGVPVHQLSLIDRMEKYIAVAEGITDCTTHSITAKQHMFCNGDDPALLWEAVQRLEATKDSLTFETDGIVFTKINGTYVGPITANGCEVSIYKWKPIEMNSVDAVITFDPEWETINGPFKAELWVGYDARNNSSDDAFAKVFMKERGRSVESKKLLAAITCIRDKMSGNVYVYENSADHWVYENLDRTVPKLALEDYTVVECQFEKMINLRTKGDYRFTVTPFRYRDDKTEMLHKTRQVIGSANEFNRAVVPILDSVKKPIEMAHLTSSVRPAFDDSVDNDTYYIGQSEVGRGSHTLNLLRDFNNAAKASMFATLYQLGKDVVTTGQRPNLLDVASGRGGDILKYAKVGYTTVLGVDVSFVNIFGLKDDGAYGRLAKLGNGIERNDYLFLCMDGSKEWKLDTIDQFKRSSVVSLVSGEELPNDRFNNLMVNNVLDTTYELPPNWPAKLVAWKGALCGGQFDTSSCMFSFHYFFTSRESHEAVVKNIASNLKKGGVFVAVFLDGRLVETALELGGSKGRITDVESGGVRPAWVIKKSGNWTLSSDPIANYGKMIDVMISSISNTFIKEPVVDVELVDLVFAEHQMERVTDIPLFDCSLFSGYIDTIASAKGSGQYDLMRSQYPKLVEYIDLHRVVAYRKVA